MKKTEIFERLIEQYEVNSHHRICNENMEAKLSYIESKLNKLREDKINLQKDKCDLRAEIQELNTALDVRNKQVSDLQSEIKNNYK